jgi:hypothetical protein
MSAASTMSAADKHARHSAARAERTYLLQLPVDCCCDIPLQSLPSSEEAIVQPHIPPATGCEHVSHVACMSAVCVNQHVTRILKVGALRIESSVEGSTYLLYSC